MVSRHPVAPQRQVSPSAAECLLWPISPVAPAAPCSTSPPAMMPIPSPVEALSTRASRGGCGWPSSSEVASAVASLARWTGASVTSARYGASGTPSQPRMTGESTLMTRTGSTVPDRLMPTASTRGSIPSSSSRNRAATTGMSSSGPVPTSWSDHTPGQLLPVEVEDAELGARASHRGGQHHAGAAVEDQRGRWAAAGGGQLLAGQQQAGLEQRGDPRDDRRTREPGGLGQLGAGAGAAGADELEQVARGRRAAAGGPRPPSVRRARSSRVPPSARRGRPGWARWPVSGRWPHARGVLPAGSDHKQAPVRGVTRTLPAGGGVS